MVLTMWRSVAAYRQYKNVMRMSLWRVFTEDGESESIDHRASRPHSHTVIGALFFLVMFVNNVINSVFFSVSIFPIPNIRKT